MLWGPKPPTRFIPVRPVAHTGQTGTGQTDREIAILWFPYLGPKLMTLISLTAVN